jgi:hypothetical protein
LGLALAGSLVPALALAAIPAKAQESEKCYGVASKGGMTVKPVCMTAKACRQPIITANPSNWSPRDLHLDGNAQGQGHAGADKILTHP